MSTDGLAELGEKIDPLDLGRRRWGEIRCVAGTVISTIKESLDKVEDLSDEKYSDDTALFLEIIIVLDHLDAWLASDEAQQSRNDEVASKWLARLEMTGKLITKILAKRQVLPMDLKSVPPGAAVVVDSVQSSDVTEETITAIRERGWLYKGEVLKKAAVAVAMPMTSGAQQTPEVETTD